jgi:O-antigen/teichoic acid export membrane protein
VATGGEHYDVHPCSLSVKQDYYACLQRPGEKDVALVGEARLRSLRRSMGIFSAASVPSIVEFTSRFGRTVILSHLLSPTDLGAALALLTIFGTCEALADVGLGPFVMVNNGAERAQAVAAVRQIGITRGILLSLLILAFAPILAKLFGSNDHIASIRWLALVLLVTGFKNWRTTQIQAEYNYRPETISISVASIFAVIVVFPAAEWFRDDRAMLASLIVESGLYVIVSGIVLPREKVPAVDRAMRRAALRFGLPLIVNGIGIVILSQADRIMVSYLFGLEVLARYGLIVGLAIGPLSFLSGILAKVLMTVVVRSRDQPREAVEASFIAVWVPFAAAAIYSLAVGSLLDLAAPLLYGARYQVTPGLLALITLMVFVRICRLGGTIILTGHARTRQVTAANLTAAAGLVCGFVLGLWRQRLEAATFGILLGDVISLGFTFYFARPLIPRYMMRHLARMLVPAVLAVGGAVSGLGFTPEVRVLVVAAGILFVTLDTIVAYRRILWKFLA